MKSGVCIVTTRRLACRNIYLLWFADDLYSDILCDILQINNLPDEFRRDPYIVKKIAMNIMQAEVHLRYLDKLYAYEQFTHRIGCWIQTDIRRITKILCSTEIISKY